MASRDLTAAFLERRSGALLRRRRRRPQEEEEEEQSGGTNDDAYSPLTVEMTAVPPATQTPVWVEYVTAVQDCIGTIQRNMEQLQALHAQRVGSVFGKENAAAEQEIHVQTVALTDQFRQAERYLHKVGVATTGTGGDAQSRVVGKNVQKSLAQQLQELSLSFRQSQRKYLAEVQAQKGGNSPVSSHSSHHDQFGMVAAAMEEGNKSFFQQQQEQTTVDDWQMASSRDKEIAQIASSIDELGTIFKELAVLVIDQGTILDRIDYNMETVVSHTNEAVDQLERAERHQKNARPMRCIICLSLTIFVLLLLLVLKHTTRRW